MSMDFPARFDASAVLPGFLLSRIWWRLAWPPGECHKTLHVLKQHFFGGRFNWAAFGKQIHQNRLWYDNIWHVCMEWNGMERNGLERNAMQCDAMYICMSACTYACLFLSNLNLNLLRSFELFTFFLVACNGLLTGIQISVPWHVAVGQPHRGICVTRLKVKGTESCGLSCVT